MSSEQTNENLANNTSGTEGRPQEDSSNKRGIEEVGNNDSGRVLKYHFSESNGIAVPSAPQLNYSDVSDLVWMRYSDGDNQENITLDTLNASIDQCKFSLGSDLYNKWRKWFVSGLTAFIDKKRRELESVPDVSYNLLSLSQFHCDLKETAGPLEEIKRKAFADAERDEASESDNGALEVKKSSDREVSEGLRCFESYQKSLKSMPRIAESVIKTWLQQKAQQYLSQPVEFQFLSERLRTQALGIQSSVNMIVDAMVYQVEILAKARKVDKREDVRQPAFAEGMFGAVANVLCQMYMKTDDPMVRQAATFAGQSLGKALDDHMKKGGRNASNIQKETLDVLQPHIESATTSTLNMISFKMCKPSIIMAHNFLMERAIADAKYAESRRASIEGEIYYADALRERFTMH